MEQLNTKRNVEECFQLIESGEYGDLDLILFVEQYTSNELRKIESLFEDLRVYYETNHADKIHRAFKERFINEEEYIQALKKKNEKVREEIEKYGSFKFNDSSNSWGFDNKVSSYINGIGNYILGLERLYFIILDLIHNKNDQSTKLNDEEEKTSVSDSTNFDPEHLNKKFIYSKYWQFINSLGIGRPEAVEKTLEWLKENGVSENHIKKILPKILEDVDTFYRSTYNNRPYQK